jgi:hypothetical protein
MALQICQNSIIFDYHTPLHFTYHIYTNMEYNDNAILIIQQTNKNIYQQTCQKSIITLKCGSQCSQSSTF